MRIVRRGGPSRRRRSTSAPPLWEVRFPARYEDLPSSQSAPPPGKTVRDHPRLLHHRAHRPRQVDAGRPHAASRSMINGAAPGRSTSTRSTSSASAASRSTSRSGCHRRSRSTTHARPARLRAEHDRRPRPRRLHLRGLALARGVRATVLLVDAAQGIEAQTLANLSGARRRPARMPVLNKINLPRRSPRCAAERGIIGCDPPRRAAGLRRPGTASPGAAAQRDHRPRPRPGRRPRRPGPRPDLRLRLRHLHSIMTYVRVSTAGRAPRRGRDDVDRRHPRDARGRRDLHQADEAGDLGVGEVGYLIAGVKDVRHPHVGDTVTSSTTAPPRRSAATSANPMVFTGLLPDDGDDYPTLRDALEQIPSTTRPWPTSRRPRVRRLRLPLRLPRPAAHGDHPGAAGASHPRPDLHGAQRGLSVLMEDGSEQIVTNPSEYPLRRQDGRGAGAGRQGDDPEPQRLHRRDHGASESKRGHDGMDYLWANQVRDALRCRSRRSSSTFSTSWSRPGLRLLDYEPNQRPAARPGQGRHPVQEAVDTFSAIVRRDAAYGYGVMFAGELAELIPRHSSRYRSRRRSAPG